MIPKPSNLKPSTIRKRAWDAFSLYIRTKAGFKCELHDLAHRKGIVLPFKCGGPLQCCHKISRTKSAILYDETNVFSGCSGSNRWEKDHRDEWQPIWKALWPEDVERLEQLKGVSVQRKVSDYLNIAEHYKRELKKL